MFPVGLSLLGLQSREREYAFNIITKHINYMSGPSPDKMGIQKEDLSSQDRLLRLKGERVSEKGMENLAKAFGNIGEIKRAIADMEKILERTSKEMEVRGLAPERQKALLDQYENIIADAEQNKLDPKEVKDWLEHVEYARVGSYVGVKVR